MGAVKLQCQVLFMSAFDWRVASQYDSGKYCNIPARRIPEPKTVKRTGNVYENKA